MLFNLLLCFATVGYAISVPIDPENAQNQQAIDRIIEQNVESQNAGRAIEPKNEELSIADRALAPSTVGLSNADRALEPNTNRPIADRAMNAVNQVAEKMNSMQQDRAGLPSLRSLIDGLENRYLTEDGKSLVRAILKQ